MTNKLKIANRNRHRNYEVLGITDKDDETAIIDIFLKNKKLKKKLSERKYGGMKIEGEDMEKRNQVEILDMKNTVLEFIISLDGFNRFNTTEEKTRDLEDVATETIQNEAQREKWLRKQYTEPQ